jgi:hypothetical protein
MEFVKRRRSPMSVDPSAMDVVRRFYKAVASDQYAFDAFWSS